jgi:two-component system chemotaxis response regulator CheB
MIEPRIRVLVVDDSAFARKVIRQSLEAAADIEVVGIARDGLDALEKIAELKPDVVTLDLVMPQLDGLGVLAALPRRGPPKVIVVTTAEHDSGLGIAALEAGAVDLVHKPTALATDRLYELGRELIEKVHAAAQARPTRPGPVNRSEPDWQAETSPRQAAPHATELVVVAASTGGPQALRILLRKLPADFLVPMAVVVHMPVGYTAAFAQRLDGECAIHVEEAESGTPFRPGVVLIARAGTHLKVAKRGGALHALLDPFPSGTPHRPSADVLFSSAVVAVGRAVLGVVLTGMGNDGLQGSRDIVVAGGRVITEAESSCIVYGMPRAVEEAGLSTRAVTIQRVAAAIAELL